MKNNENSNRVKVDKELTNALIARLKANPKDEEAFNLLLDRYTALINSCMNKHNLKGDDEFNDLAAKLFVIIDKYDMSKDSFTTYLRRSLNNYIIDKWRKDKKKKFDSLDENTVPDDEDYLQKLIADEEREKTLKKAKKVLSDFEYRVFKLIYVDGIEKPSELAPLFKKPKKSIENVKTRIKQKSHLFMNELKDNLGE